MTKKPLLKIILLQNSNYVKINECNKSYSVQTYQERFSVMDYAGHKKYKNVILCHKT